MANVWRFFPHGWWYITHPVRFLKELFRPFKWAWQRSCRGYADCDCWDVGSFLIKITPRLLSGLAQNADCHPYGKFDSVSDWSEYLEEIAVHLKNADADKYTGNATYSSSILDYRQKELEHALDMLKPVFFNLWD